MTARATLRSTLLAFAAATAAWQAGCATGGANGGPARGEGGGGGVEALEVSRDGKRAGPEPAGGALVVGELEPATRGVRASDLVREPGSVARFAIVGGDGAGRAGRVAGGAVEVIERVVRETDAEGRVRVVLVEERGGKVENRMELEPLADGGFALALVDAIGDRSRSLFETPLPFAADLAPDAPLEGASDMRVVTIPGGKARAKGTARRSLGIAGECDLVLGGERLRATALDLAFEVSLDVAKASVRARLFVVPGRGVVAEEREETRVVLGVFRTTTRETTALLSVEGVPTPAPPAGAR